MKLSPAIQYARHPIIAVAATSVAFYLFILAFGQSFGFGAKLATPILQTVAVAAIIWASVRFTHQNMVAGADHITDAICSARDAGAEPTMQYVTYLPTLFFTKKGSEPWVGLLLWQVGSSVTTARVYGHGKKAYEGLSFAEPKTADV